MYKLIRCYLTLSARVSKKPMNVQVKVNVLVTLPDKYFDFISTLTFPQFFIGQVVWEQVSPKHSIQLLFGCVKLG